MRAAEPENPILQAEPQEITVLQAGKALGGAGSGDGVETSGSGANGDTESDLTGDVEQPDPDETDNEAGQDTEPETVPQDQPTQSDYSEASIGTNMDSNQGDDGEEAGETGEVDQDLPLSPLDLGAALTWYKYGSQPTSIVCAPGKTVGKLVLLAQLDNGMLPYRLDLTGLDAQDAVITGVFFASGNAATAEISTIGAVPMSLPDGAEYQNYVFIVEATATQKNQKGETVKTNVQFTFLLQLESGIDLDLQLSWQTLTAPAQATCFANSSVSRTIKGDTIQDGLFQYDFLFLGESAREAEFISADYRATDGETGTLTQSGTLQMAPADGQDSETYSITVIARVSGQTIRYSFVLTYEDGLDLQLQFTWYEKSVTAQTLLCDADKRVNLTIKHNQLQNGELLYKFGLKGKSANDAQILSATIDNTALNPEKGSYQLTASEGGTTYTILVSAKVKDKTVTFTVTLRYQSDVSLQMSYTLTDPETHASIPCSLTCENGRTNTADPIYDDQLTDGLLSYQLTISGEEASDVTITSVSCYQSGNFSTKPLTAPSGSVALLLAEDGTTGENTFTVKASGAGTEYTFTLSLPYKHRGNNSIQITCSLSDDATIAYGTDVVFTVEAWAEDSNGTPIEYIYASGNNTKLVVQIDGQNCYATSTTGTKQQFILNVKKSKDEKTIKHDLYIYAEDSKGNYGDKHIRLIGKENEKGQKIGTAIIYVDMGVLGLGTSRAVQYNVLSGEPISYSIAKAIWGYDAGDPFGKAVDTLGWPSNTVEMTGSLDQRFYLAGLDDGTNLGQQAKALSGRWLDYGSNEQEVFERIDQIFGKGTNLDILWRCIYRNGIDLGNVYSGLRELEFTAGAGWMYAVNGTYLSDSMSSISLNDGDSLVLRYTLAYGWDIGGGGRSHGNNNGYCISYADGKWTVKHNNQSVKDAETGTVHTVCRFCGIEDACSHLKTKYVDQKNGSCALICEDCGQALTDPESHKYTYSYEENSEIHVVGCEHGCGFKKEEAHTLQESNEQDSINQPSCTQGGILRYNCIDCGAVIEKKVAALGHDADRWLSDGAHHYKFCHRCEQEIEKAKHEYINGYSDWKCTVCQMYHISACDVGEFTWNNGATTDSGHELSCNGCGISVTEGHQFNEAGACTICEYTKVPDIPEHVCADYIQNAIANDDHTHTGTCSVCSKAVTRDHDTLGADGSCSVCGHTSAPENPEHNCAEHIQNAIDNGNGTHTGTCSICSKAVTQVHTFENGFCIYCYAPQPAEPTEPETPTESEEGENQDE